MERRHDRHAQLENLGRYCHFRDSDRQHDRADEARRTGDEATIEARTQRHGRCSCAQSVPAAKATANAPMLAVGRRGNGLICLCRNG